MSRVIDESKPLKAEDREFLLQNGQENRVRRLDEQHGVTGEPQTPTFMSGDEPSLLTGVPAGTINAPGLTPATVAANVGAAHLALASLTDEDIKAELQRRQDVREAAEEGTAGSDQSPALSSVVREDEGDVPPYDEWRTTTLRAQLGVRELNKSGNKPELVDRLREDDADQA